MVLYCSIWPAIGLFFCAVAAIVIVGAIPIGLGWLCFSGVQLLAEKARGPEKPIFDEHL